jgi:hypothetical protein
MRQNSSFAALIFVVILGAGGAIAFGLHHASADVAAIVVMVCSAVLAYIVAAGIKVADQWSKAVVLRLGKFRSLEGPGLFLIIPSLSPSPIGSIPASSQVLSKQRRRSPKTRFPWT